MEVARRVVVDSNTIISGILIPGETGGTLIIANSKSNYDTLCVSSAGIVYRP